MIVAVSVALAPFARRLIIDPQRFSGQNPDSVVDFGNDSPMKTFGELEASDWLELAYRPSNSDAIVMRMLTNAPAPVFLRAQTFTEWTGRTWQRGTAPSVQRSTRQGSWITRPGAEDDVRKHRRSDRLLPQTIPLGVHRSYISTRVRFRGYTPVPTEPLASIWLGDLDNDVQWFEDGTAAPSGVGPNSYAVLFRPDPSGEVDLNRPDLVSLDRISTRVQDLARSITEDAVTPEDKIQAIRSWMAANIRYDLSIDSPRRGDDPIEHVLFGTRAGSCTHFSTATTALLRSVGIPARVATGFVAQTQRRPGELLVRGKDAHAWAEIPLTNGAWMSVDTTLGAQVNDESRADAFRGPLGVLAIAVGLVAIIALAMAARRRRLLVRLQTPTQRAWTQLHKIGARVGVTPSQSTTMRSYAKSLDERLRSAPLAAHAAAELEAAAFASGGATSQTEMIASVETDLRALDARAKEVRRNERRQRLQRRSRSSRQTSRAERAERAERATNLSVQHNENADESTGIDRS